MIYDHSKSFFYRWSIRCHISIRDDIWYVPHTFIIESLRYQRNDVKWFFLLLFPECYKVVYFQRSRLTFWRNIRWKNMGISQRVNLSRYRWFRHKAFSICKSIYFLTYFGFSLFLRIACNLSYKLSVKYFFFTILVR